MQRSLRARDEGLRRVSIATRVAVVGAVAASGLFTTLAAWAQPGRTKSIGATGQGRAAAAPAASPGANRGDGGGGGDDSNLSPPAAVPDPGYQYSGPVVVSGAS